MVYTVRGNTYQVKLCVMTSLLGVLDHFLEDEYSHNANIIFVLSEIT